MLSPLAVADNSDMADEQGMTEPGGTSPPPAEAAAGKPKARELNELIRYTMWSVFRVSDRAWGWSSRGYETAAAEVADLLDQAAGKGIVTRGPLRPASVPGRRRFHVLVDRPDLR